jgi:hypothetical protein
MSPKNPDARPKAQPPLEPAAQDVASPDVVAEPVAAPSTPPRPRSVHAVWYPAGIVLPGPERRILNRVKIYAADTGLYVFTAADENTPAWYSPILFEKTPPPLTGIMAMSGVPITTEAGAALITPMGGCGCRSALKLWTPSWAVMESGWPSGA